MVVSFFDFFVSFESWTELLDDPAQSKECNWASRSSIEPYILSRVKRVPRLRLCLRDH